MSIAEKGDMVRNLGLLFSAVVGVFFLAWRAISNDRIARAALRQAQVAASQLQLANKAMDLQTRQVEATNQQVLILSKNADLSNRALQETLSNNLYGHFRAAMTTLAEAESSLHRVAGIILVAEAARADHDFLSPALLAFEQCARDISPASSFDIQEYEVIPSLNGDNKHAIVKALKRLPFSFWLKVKPALLDHLNLHGFLQSLDACEGTVLTEKQEQVVTFLWSRITSLHPAAIHSFWYEHMCKPELQTVINVLGNLKKTYPEWSMPLSRIRLDGYDFAVRNFSDTNLSLSSLRGANCFMTDFSGVIAVACDFRSAWLQKANFTGANLSYCDFAGCALEGAIFVDADISGARFVNCLGFDEVQLSKAKNADEAILR